jgi:hypothetical protein
MVNIDRPVPPAALQPEQPNSVRDSLQKGAPRANSHPDSGNGAGGHKLRKADLPRSLGQDPRTIPDRGKFFVWRSRRRGQNEWDAALGSNSTERHAHEHELERGVLLCVETNISSRAERRKQIISIRPINDTTTTIRAL